VPLSDSASNAGRIIVSFQDYQYEQATLAVPRGLRWEVECLPQDEARYLMYITNALMDLCAKVEARLPRGQPTEAQRYNAVKHVRQLALVKHLTENASDGSMGQMQFLDDESTSANDAQHHLRNIAAVVALDTLTKASEHILHAPNRISYLLNNYVAQNYKQTNLNISFAFPPMNELLLGHEQLATADLSLQKTENEVTM
jgi:hypothetical protein